MSAPDRIELTREIPPQYCGFPYLVALLPAGVTLATLGSPGHRMAGVFQIDPDCAGSALNDPALDHYIATGVPVLLYASRGRDLRPFLRRSDAFRRRGATVVLVQ